MNRSLAPDRKAVTGWAIYDFANTMFSMNIVTMYFAQWLVVDNKVEDIYYSVSYALSMLLVAATMPALGAISDAKGKRMPSLAILTGGCILATLVLGITSGLMSGATSKILVALILFALANYGFEGGLVFYNALLPEVSTQESIGRVSGWGVALGYVGAITGLLLVKPFVDGHIFGLELPFSQGGRQSAFIPTALLFLLFSLPIFLWVKDRVPRSLEKIRFKEAFRRVWEGIANTRKFPGVRRFLVAYYFFSDAIATVVIFMAVYAQVVMGFPDSVKIWFFIVATTFAVIGSFLCGYVTDWIGPKKALTFAVLGWIFSLLVIIFTADKTIFWAVGPLIGICLGSTWTASRPLLTGLVPRETLGQFFGLYALSGKVAAVAGPILWGVAVLFFKADNLLVHGLVSLLKKTGFAFSHHVLSTIQYRFAVGILVLMMVSGLIILLKVPDRFERKVPSRTT
ncbi:MAG: MFS transporter [Candidatus Zixiibacteriota bacterium]|nr:MAG: MFS transporter [candidate division Zixibacteria bacterium]